MSERQSPTFSHCRVCGKPTTALDAVDGLHGNTECVERVQKWAKERGMPWKAWPTNDVRGQLWSVTIDRYVEQHQFTPEGEVK